METFKSFEQLYEWAKTRIPVPLIPSFEIGNLNEVARKALDDIDRAYYANEFNKWLIEEKKWNPEPKITCFIDYQRLIASYENQSEIKRKVLDNIGFPKYKNEFKNWLAKEKKWNPDSKKPINPLTKENFCDFLQDKKQELERFIKESEAKDRQWLLKAGLIEETLTKEEVPPIPQSNFEQAEYVLLCYYEYAVADKEEKPKWKITGTSCEIFAAGKWTSASSGQSLRNWFIRFEESNNRTGNDFSLRELKKQMRRIEKIMPSLSEKSLKMAEDELKVIRNNIEKHTI